ncbi:hypothetical protein J6590_053082 [Homalodisca vitripennis]|nr:hypothetical protein J6590_053082 [Homalodisca vitripennis]
MGRSLKLTRPNFEGENTIGVEDLKEFGGNKRQSRNFFLVPVEQRDWDTLLDVIKE